MKRYIFCFLIVVVLPFQTLIGQEKQSESNSQLFIKTDVLLPILSLISPENDFIFGASLEYKLKQPWSIHLSGYYYGQKIRYQMSGFQVIPEGRYFFHQYHFSGIYFKYDQQDYTDYPLNYQQKGQKMAIGGLYGYQREVRRWIFEGRIGLGINQDVSASGIFGNGSFEISEGRLSLDMILAFNIGCRIF